MPKRHEIDNRVAIQQRQKTGSIGIKKVILTKNDHDPIKFLILIVVV